MTPTTSFVVYSETQPRARITNKKKMRTTNNMKIKIKLTNPGAKVPTQAHTDDFGFDCYATSCDEIAPNVYRYGLGIALQVVRPVYLQQSPNFKIGISARPRSSVWKTGMVLSNCIGTIDEGYTGEISAVFYHVLPDMPKYEIGDRVCQLHLDFSEGMEFEIVDELESNTRGVNGYGSSGK